MHFTEVIEPIEQIDRIEWFDQFAASDRLIEPMNLIDEGYFLPLTNCRVWWDDGERTPRREFAVAKPSKKSPKDPDKRRARDRDSETAALMSAIQGEGQKRVQLSVRFLPDSLMAARATAWWIRADFAEFMDQAVLDAIDRFYKEHADLKGMQVGEVIARYEHHVAEMKRMKLESMLIKSKKSK